MNYKKSFVAIAIVAIAVCSVLGIVFIERDNLKTGIDLATSSVNTEATTQFATESLGDNPASETSLLKDPEQENEPITTGKTADSQIVNPPNKATQPEVFAEITIRTCAKTGTYTVMPDVNEKTLMNNIGWLPASSLPGEDGLCVLMGHRDTDFGILQYIGVGDEITVDYGNSSCVYTVTKVEIADNDNELRFSVMSDPNLALVTCYPFHYAGHAPKKLVVYSQITN